MRQELIDHFSLDGRVAVVTGAASGIGQETVLTLARAGARVVGTDRQKEACEETSVLSTNEGLTCEFIAADVSNRTEVLEIGNYALKKYGRVDAWANVAGILQYDFIVDIDPKKVAEIIAVNQLGVLWGITAAALVMKNGGSIISIASAGGEMPYPRLAAYGMTKAAVMQLTRTAALEFGELGIRVNAVAPGFVETPMVAINYTLPNGSVDLEAKAKIFDIRSEQSPLGITGKPIDIALAVLYLASDSSRFMTGQTIRPNGGTYYG